MIEIEYSPNIILTGVAVETDESHDHEFGVNKLSDMKVKDFRIYLRDDFDDFEITQEVKAKAPRKYNQYKTYFLDHCFAKVDDAS